MRKANTRGDGSGPDTKRSKALPRQVPQQSEAELLKGTRGLLDILTAQGLLAYRRIHVMPIQVMPGVVRPNIDGKGMEDLQVYLLQGRTLYWELKSMSGKQSPEQKQREKELTALGHHYSVIRSIDNALSILKQYGLNIFAMPVTK